MVDLKALGHDPVAPVGKKQPAGSRASSSASTGTRPVRAEAEGPSRVEPVHRKPRIKVFVDEETGRPAFLVIDDETGDLIREVPPHEVLELAARMKKMAGLLLDEVV